MLKSLQHRAAIAVESMKKGKGPSYFDPAFEEASACLQELKTTIQSFIEDANAILGVIPRIFKGAAEFSSLTTKCFDTFPEEDRVVSASLATFTAEMTAIVESRIGSSSSDSVIRPFKDLLRTLEDLTRVQKQQHDCFMLLEANKAKLESLQKDPEKNAAQIQQYQEKITARTTEAQQLETEFITRTRAVWDNRFDVLKPPITALLGIVTEIGLALVTSSEPIVEALGPELMGTEFPAAEPAAPKAKK